MLRLYIKDNATGAVREYGTSPHDSLELQTDGSLHYINIQCMAGTRYPEEGYSFCKEDGGIPTADEDFVLDIGGEYYNEKARERR